MKKETKNIIWGSIIIISFIFSTIAVFDIEEVKVHKVDKIKLDKGDLVEYSSRYYAQSIPDFILDTLSYDCIGKVKYEDELDRDKTERCNEYKKVYCQAGFYLRIWAESDAICIIEYDKYEYKLVIE